MVSISTKLFSSLLSILLLLLTLGVSLAPEATLPERLYAVRLPLILAGTVVLALTYAAQATQGRTMLTALRSRKYSFMFFAGAAYGLWALLCAVRSPMSGYAFFGAPYLQFGALMLAGCLALSWLYSRSSSINLLVWTIQLSTAIVLLFTVLESIGLRPLDNWISSPRISYPASLIGHRPHLGGWFAVIALIPIFFYHDRDLNRSFWFWLLSGFIGLSLTTTTAAVIGVIAGLVIWLIINSITRQHPLKSPLIALLSLIILLIATPIATRWTAHSFGLTPPQVKDYSSTNSIKPRLYMWKAALEGGLRSPIFGWGDETFGYQVFDLLSPKDAKNLYRVELGIPESDPIWYSGFTYYTKSKSSEKVSSGTLIYVRSHNLFADEIYSHGFIGFILLFIYILSLVKRLFTKNFDGFYLIIALIPYFVYLMAWFFIPTVSPLYFITAAIMIAYLRNKSSLRHLS